MSPDRTFVCLLCALAVTGASVGCRNTSDRSSSRAESSPPWFEEIATRAGIDFVHRSGHESKHYLPEIMGGGAALFDMDNDGFLDVYLVQSGSLAHEASGTGSRLYRNRGDGSFEDVTERSGAGVHSYGMGVAAGDFDNDGNTDLYVTGFGRNVLLKNDGHGHFADVTGSAGVGGGGWSTSAAFLDYDGDGFLDLFVTRYMNWKASAEIECFSLTGVPDYCSPASYDLPSASLLFHNNRNGTFTDVSENAGIQSAVGNGLGVVAGDFDGDRRVDVFVANDRTANHLWLNQGSGRFRESALAMGCALDQDGVAKSGMGVYAVDADDDGDLDLLVVNLDGESDSFFRNQGRFFADDTVSVGLRTPTRPFTRFGAALLDFDNDGALDLYEANGRVGRQSEVYAADPYAEPSLLLRGFPGPRFEEVRPRGGIASPLFATGRAAAFGDIDNDGGTDIVVVNRDSRAYLLHNVVKPRGHWATIRALDHGRDAIGAQITMTVGQRTIRRDVRAAYSYLASNDPRVHVGLGQEAVMRNVGVSWADGVRETFGDLPIDRIVTLKRGSGNPGS
jgi:enediyne biosynthesis protein E4